MTPFLLIEEFHTNAIYMAKQTMMVAQAAPKTQPGGVHGALFKSAYQSEFTPFDVNKTPQAERRKINDKKYDYSIKHIQTCLLCWIDLLISSTFH